MTQTFYGIVKRQGRLRVRLIAGNASQAWRRLRAELPMLQTIPEARKVGYCCRRLSITYKS